MRSVDVGTPLGITTVPFAQPPLHDYERMAAWGFDTKEKPLWLRWNSGLKGMVPVKKEFVLADLSAMMKAIRDFISNEKDPRALSAEAIHSLVLLAERFNLFLGPINGVLIPPPGLKFQEFVEELARLYDLVQATPEETEFDKQGIEVFFELLIPAYGFLRRCKMQVAMDSMVLVQRIGTPTIKDLRQSNLGKAGLSQGVIAPAQDSLASGISSAPSQRETTTHEERKPKAIPHATIQFEKYALPVSLGKKTRDECHQEYAAENAGRNPYARSSFIAKLSHWMRDNNLDPKGQAP